MITHGAFAIGRGLAAGMPAAAITSLAKVFDPSIRAAPDSRPEHGDPGVAKLIGDPGDERRLGPDHDQVGGDRARNAEEPVAVVDANGMAVTEGRNPGVAGRRVQLRQRRARRDAPRKRMLAGSRADEKHLHARRVYGESEAAGIANPS